MSADKVELRGMAPLELAQALDAIAMAKGTDRNSYVVQVLTDEVARYLHEATVVTRVLRGNPLMPEEGGRANG